MRTYTWGRDLSGTLQSAGGVGGLLAISEITSPDFDVHSSTSDVRLSKNRFPIYDANGNIGQMIAEDSSIKAGFQYSAFGSVTATFGEEAEENPWRFSTKPVEADTGWSYYGFRYYDAENGRWASRDPIEESGGVNLYGFVGNDGVGGVDLLGLQVGTGTSWPMKLQRDDGQTCYFCENAFVAVLIDGVNTRRRCCGKILQDIHGDKVAGCWNGQPYSGDFSCCKGGALVPKVEEYWESRYSSYQECVYKEAASTDGLIGGAVVSTVAGLLTGGNPNAMNGGALAGAFATSSVKCQLRVCVNES